MTLNEFLKRSKDKAYKHDWKAYNGSYIADYKCAKCNEISSFAWNAATCISDDEVIIKKLLE